MHRREGVVLVAALMALLALEAAALGLLFLATQETVVARAHERALRARLAAEDAAIDAAIAIIEHVAAGGGFDEADSRAPDSGGVDPSAGGDEAPARADHEATGPDWLLVRGAADEGGVSGRAALLLERPDPLRFLPAFAEVGDDAAAANRDAARAALLTLPARVESGWQLLRPVRNGDRCVIAAPGNWGAPDEPAHPCRAYTPLIRIDDTLELTGGSGQAIVLVAGQLSIAASVRLDAAIVVAGRLDIEAGAFVRGAVAVLPGAVVNGVVVTDGETLSRLLAAAPALRIPHAAQRLWLPAFQSGKK